MHKRAPNFLQWIAFVIAYFVLDWASYFNDFHGLDITPWNPALPLGLVCWLRYGRLTAIPWFVALLLGEILIRGLPAPLLPTIAVLGALAVGYGALAEALRRHMTAGVILTDQRHLISWFATVIFGTLATSCLYIFLLFFFGRIPTEDLVVALARFWVGDCIGIIVMMPFFGMFFENRDRLREVLLLRETAAYGILAVASLLIVFGLGGKGIYFNLLFLPIVWAAARQGMIGASVAALILQVGIIIAVLYLNLADIAVFKLQIRGAFMSFVGFFIGVIIDEKQRVNIELQQTLRLAAAGEMAGALAHELNQPLTALSAYGTACEQLLEQGETGDRLHETIRHMISEAFRAADVVRSLRDFFHTGTTQLEQITLGDLLVSAAAPFMVKAQQQGVELAIGPVPPCTLAADRLQLEVVLRNLLSNAFDAVAEQPAGLRRIRLSSQLEGAVRICVCVEDSGSGLSVEAAARVFEAFHSTKVSGLGLGLAISRAIVEAHGGRLWAEVTDHGLFKFVLPTEERTNHAT